MTDQTTGPYTIHYRRVAWLHWEWVVTDSLVTVVGAGRTATKWGAISMASRRRRDLWTIGYAAESINTKLGGWSIR